MKSKKRKIEWREVEDIIRAFLGLKYRLVGVKVVKDYDSMLNLPRPPQPIMNCEAVKKVAEESQPLLITKQDEACPSAVLALGYHTAGTVQKDSAFELSDVKAIVLFPLVDSEITPDVVIAILNPSQMADLAASIHSRTQQPINARFRGRISCAEYLAVPYVNGRANVTFMCRGGRLYAGYKDTELLFGSPPADYVQAAETMKHMVQLGGSLCGCRTSDLPDTVRFSFERAGLSKGIDYFFGRIEGHNLRVYLNKDFQGNYRFVTVYMPIRMVSQTEASEIAERLKPILENKPYAARTRGYWLDLTITATADALGIDLETGENLDLALKKTAESMILHLKQAGYDGGG